MIDDLNPDRVLYVKNPDGTYRIEYDTISGYPDDKNSIVPVTLTYPKVGVTWHKPARTHYFAVPVPVGFNVMADDGEDPVIFTFEIPE